MKITHIKLSGYQSIRPDIPFDIGELGHLNVFVGPNNAGKSCLFRLLSALARHITAKKRLMQALGAPDGFDTKWCWNYEDASAISLDISVLVDSNFNKSLLSDCCLQIDGRSIIHACSKPTWWMSPLMWPSGQEMVAIAPSQKNSSAILVPASAGKDAVEHDVNTRHDLSDPLSKPSDYIPAENHYREVYCAMRLLYEFYTSLRFFDPIRAIDRGAGWRGIDDGSQLLETIWKRQISNVKTFEYERDMEELRSHLNNLLMPCGISPVSSIRATSGLGNKPRLRFGFGGATHDVDDLGTGISQLALILYSLIEDKGKHRIYFIEEPETNVHPGLLRRLVSMLQAEVNIQFFITTHSSAVLDQLAATDCLIGVRQDKDGASHFEKCDTRAKQSFVLDALGVSGSDLLQANCVIWVEGPSDRIYIREWLNVAKPDLLEGSDYTFVYYGGSLLSHASMEYQDDAEIDLVLLLKASRFSAVVMDRDAAGGTSDTELSKTKQRIIKETQEDASHRLARVTIGRDIENDLPLELLLGAAARLLRREKIELTCKTLPQAKGFEQEIAADIEPIEANRKSLVRKLGHKVGLAKEFKELLVEMPLIAANIPPYVHELVKLIERSREPDKRAERIGRVEE